MSKYLLHGTLKAKEDKQTELAGILLKASKLISSAKGCQLYIVSLHKGDSSSVYITEIWDSKEDHDNSLQIDGVRELIMKAMPILDSTHQKGQELEILGGVGIS